MNIQDGITLVTQLKQVINNAFINSAYFIGSIIVLAYIKDQLYTIVKGFTLKRSKTILVNSEVEIDGHKGVIISIGLYSIKLLTREDDFIFIPIKKIDEKTIKVFASITNVSAQLEIDELRKEVAELRNETTKD